MVSQPGGANDLERIHGSKRVAPNVDAGFRHLLPGPVTGFPSRHGEGSTPGLNGDAAVFPTLHDASTKSVTHRCAERVGLLRAHSGYWIVRKIARSCGTG